MIGLLFLAIATETPQRSQIEACRTWIAERPWAQQATDPRARAISNRVVCFDGRIDSVSVRPLLRWLERYSRSADRPALVIRSQGGEAGAALDVAGRLQDSDADIYVDRICASSCANYFYAGVRRRHVLGRALVLFHGGYSDQSRAMVAAALDREPASDAIASPDPAARRDALARFDRDRGRQAELYRVAGVDPAIVEQVDALDFRTISDRDCGGPSRRRREFLFFAPRQAARLGIAPVSGQPDSDPQRINRAIAELGRDYIACRAPDAIFPAVP